MSFAWPIALWGLALVALAPRRLPRRAAAAAPLRRPLHQPRPARERRRRLAALAAPHPGGAHPARAERARGRDGAAAGRRRRAARGGDGDPRDGQLRLDDGDRRRARPDDAAREAASSFVEDLPDGFRVGVVSFSNEADVVVPPTADRDEALRGLGSLRADNGTALGDAIARSVDLGVTSLDEQLAAAEEETRRSSCSSSPTARTRPATTSRSRRRRRPPTPSVPVYTVALGTDEGTVQGPDGYGGTRTIRVPPDPETLAAGRRADRRHVLRGRRRGRPAERLRRDRLAGGGG